MQKMKDASADGRYSMWRSVAPCPFCGGLPKLYIEENKGLTMAAMVQCGNCGASGPMVKREKDHRTQELSKQDPGTMALSLWCNRRA